MAQLIKPQIKWTEDKINLLKEEYPLGNKEELSKKLGIKRSTLKDAARRFGVKSQTSSNNFAYAKLLEDFNECWYWQGYIIGDGHIRETGILTITVSEKDKTHLEKLQSFISGKIKNFQKTTGYTTRNYSVFTAHDTDSAIKFLNRYKLSGPKTYNPPDLSCLDDKEKFTSFFIGFFDADGCFDIRQNNKIASLKIEVHLNWKNNLVYIANKLKEYYDIDCSVKQTSRGYVKLLIHKFKFIKLLKIISQNLVIPYMERKWNLVDIHYIPKKFIVEEMYEKISIMLEKNQTWKQIAEELNLSINSLRRRYKKLTNEKFVL